MISTSVTRMATQKDKVLSSFKAISDARKMSPGLCVEFNDLQEKVVRSRRNIWGKPVQKEVMMSVSPEKAAEDYMKSTSIYVQHMILAFVPAGFPVPVGQPQMIANDGDLARAASGAPLAKPAQAVA